MSTRSIASHGQTTIYDVSARSEKNGQGQTQSYCSRRPHAHVVPSSWTLQLERNALTFHVDLATQLNISKLFSDGTSIVIQAIRSNEISLLEYNVTCKIWHEQNVSRMPRLVATICPFLSGGKSHVMLLLILTYFNEWLVNNWSIVFAQIPKKLRKFLPQSIKCNLVVRFWYSFAIRNKQSNSGELSLLCK